jgi:hypothetical protein
MAFRLHSSLYIQCHHRSGKTSEEQAVVRIDIELVLSARGKAGIGAFCNVPGRKERRLAAGKA